ncbi:TetR/AcrR family transcriptional regulator [Antrihabitans sp. YC3-6]|uniref:TetR/AcrR family transcriptional regulator n=1 Tax=Antrihabitans stalagmiti TaxID=2799499 RepID=A0A934NPJ0_9NOCA|nr:TetR/AcrR family transcriptional regulator [Antrihabitans stalagmiti]MBJ8339056.1 TetR/AcrR family transcriptional regulator [Antrihabitans stalagmiti]
MSSPKPISRAEAQEQTRELILQTAEELFIANGFHATTVAQIASKAVRTQGSIYGNFASKDALCLEVIRRRYLKSFTDLGISLATASSLDAKLDLLTEWWETLTSQHDLTFLVAEYMLAAWRDPAQRASMLEYVGLIKSVVGSIIIENFGAVDDGSFLEMTDVATISMLSLGSGLAVGRATGIATVNESSFGFTETIKLWKTKLQDSAVASR